MRKKIAITPRLIESFREAATVYADNLLDRDFLFLYGDIRNPAILECRFLASNFPHLAGLSPRIDRDLEGRQRRAVTAGSLFRKCLVGDLSDHDIEEISPYVQDKLDNMPALGNLSMYASQLTTYDGDELELLEFGKEYLLSNPKMGFALRVRESTSDPNSFYYTPVSSLRLTPERLYDMSRESDYLEAKPIRAVFSKDVPDVLYTKLERRQRNFKKSKCPVLSSIMRAYIDLDAIASPGDNDLYELGILDYPSEKGREYIDSHPEL